eukprot:3898010-Prymnesium_polylepis.1
MLSQKTEEKGDPQERSIPHTPVYPQSMSRRRQAIPRIPHTPGGARERYTPLGHTHIQQETPGSHLGVHGLERL